MCLTPETFCLLLQDSWGRMNVVISQPMKGTTEEQVRAERAGTVKLLGAEGHTVIDTVFPGFFSNTSWVRHEGRIYCWDKTAGQIVEIKMTDIPLEKVSNDVLAAMMNSEGE